MSEETTVVDPDEDSLFAVVRQAWMEALPNTPFDPEESWEASGADSLRSLHLVMALETGLGRRVPYNLLWRQMTPRDLVRVLRTPPAPPRADAPVVFLFPGVFGDEPILADFRRSFGDEMRFVVVELPDLDVQTSVHVDMPATGRRMAEELERLAPEGSIVLAGYSFGGMAAFEAAHHLFARGRRIALLALLDTFTGGDPGVAAAEMYERQEAHEAPDLGQPTVARIKPRAGEGFAAFAERLVFGLALRFGWHDLARRVTVFGRKRLSRDQIIGRRRILLGLSRIKAVNNWSPRPLDVPVFLACSDDGAEKSLPAKWAQLCPRLDVLRLPGRHREIFGDPALALLNPAFAKAVRDAAETIPA